MNTYAVRIYGKNDLRLEKFDLPAIGKDEILAKVVTDSLCMSSNKLSNQGSKHKRAPDNLSENPIIIGHEFCGEILEVGTKWQSEFSIGDKFVIQPALNYKGSLDAPGYSFEYIGGDATYIVIPNIVMEQQCLLKFYGEAYFLGSLSEPICCVIGGCNAMYHVPHGTYEHYMGIKEEGNMVLFAGTGPMGLAMIDYCVHGPRKPSTLIVTSTNEQKLKKAEQIYSIEEAKRNGVNLVFLHTPDGTQTKNIMLKICPEKYNDIVIMAAVEELVVIADELLAKDGCLNFFAGPSDTSFSAPLNLYNVHYSFTHVVSNSGGNSEDLKIALDLLSRKILNPAPLVSHIGGLNTVAETTKNLPNIPGSKKLMYTHKDIPLTAIEDFKKLGEEGNSFFADLAEIVKSNKGMWCIAAEKYVLEHAKDIEL